MLIKRTHIAPALLLALAVPATALAAGNGDSDPKIAVNDAQVAEIAPLQRPIDRFHRVIHTVSHQIRAERRAELRRQRRELFATLPAGVSMSTLESIAACESGGDPAAAPEKEQDYRAALLYAQSGSSPWPVCG